MLETNKSDKLMWVFRRNHLHAVIYSVNIPMSFGVESRNTMNNLLPQFYFAFSQNLNTG